MTSATLTKELLDDASAHRLILRVAPRRLSALIAGPEGVERSVLFHSEELADGSVRSLENAIYDNPLLLSDFSTVDIIFSTPELFLAPEGTEELHEAMADAMLPDSDAPRRVLACPFGEEGTVCYTVNADIHNFLTRTFACARFHHALAIDARALAALSRPDGAATTYALCEGEGEMAIASFGADGSMRYLNRPRPLTAADCAYYLLAATAESEPLTIGAADPELQGAVSETLRKVRPDARILPLALDPELLYLRRTAPQATFDIIFLTQQ